MISGPKWLRIGGLEPNPFSSGEKERPLRLTVHSGSFDSSDSDSMAALDALYELSELEIVDLYDFDGRSGFRIQVHPLEDTARNHTITIHDSDDTILQFSSGPYPSSYDDRSIQLLSGLHDSNSPAYQKVGQDLLHFEAHNSLDRDFFITGSSFLLRQREDFEYGNPRSALEGSGILGLFLRSRNIWTYRIEGNRKYRSSKDMYFWKLTRSMLPGMWKYFSCAVYSAPKFHDLVFPLSSSILERCKRVLQARDQIGIRFYLPQSHTVRDEMMYHFDYLTLLIVGAFDAFAGVTNAAYGLDQSGMGISFRREKFQKKLLKAGGENLVDLVTSEHCQHLIEMLHNLRNLIHSTALRSYAIAEFGEEGPSFATLPESIKDTIWSTANTINSSERWGLIRRQYTLVKGKTGEKEDRDDVSIEPYSYSTELISQWFSLLDEISRCTDIERTVPKENISCLKAEAPSDWIEDMARFSLLSHLQSYTG